MRNQITKKKEKKVMNSNVVVKIVKSGVRFNAWDADGKKWTSHIGTSTRKGAFENNMALEQKVILE